MILCSPTPSSIIKAALLSHIYTDLPSLHDEQENLGLFRHTSEIDADSYSAAELIRRLRQDCGLNAEWVLDSPGKSLSHHISGNLRYQAPDQAAVIFAAVEQAIRYGHTYCLCGIGSISRIFISRTRAVWHEVHRMVGFIRFNPAPDNTLVTTPKLYHNTADLILRKISVKYPNNKLVAILPETAFMMRDGLLSEVSRQDYAHYAQNDSFEKAWDTYYNSQFIAARKNIRLAQRVIPRKYWNWLSEGKTLEQESTTML